MLVSCCEQNILILLLESISIDMKLTFDYHVSEICCKAAGQLNVLKRLSFYLPFNAKKVSDDAFMFSNFNYCPLVWYFLAAKQLQKIEKVQARTLRFMHNDYESSYDVLLIKSEAVTMEVKRMQSLCIEIYKTLNNANPQHVNEIFALNRSLYSSRRPYSLTLPRIIQSTLVLDLYDTRGLGFGTIYQMTLRWLKTTTVYENDKCLEGPITSANIWLKISNNHYCSIMYTSETSTSWLLPLLY